MTALASASFHKRKKLIGVALVSSFIKAMIGTMLKTMLGPKDNAKDNARAKAVTCYSVLLSSFSDALAC